MSVKTMGRVWELNLPHSHMLVLLALADHADHEGANIYPSVGLVAWKCGYSERQVQRIMSELVESGVLVKVSTKPGKKVTYRIDTTKSEQKTPYKGRQNVRGDILSGVTNAPQGGDILTDHGVTYTTFSRKGLEQQDAPNPDPIRHVDPSGDPSVGERGKKQAISTTHAPAVQAYFDTYPNETLDADQIADITRTVVDISKWKEVLRYWKGNGHRARSVLKMLDRYSSGASIADDRPGGNRQQSNGARAPTDLPLVTASDTARKNLPTLEERKQIIDARRK